MILYSQKLWRGIKFCDLPVYYWIKIQYPPIFLQWWFVSQRQYFWLYSNWGSWLVIVVPGFRFMFWYAAATASTLNSVLMRHHELREGIEVVDDQGNVMGTSIIAAKRVLTITAQLCEINDPVPIWSCAYNIVCAHVNWRPCIDLRVVHVKLTTLYQFLWVCDIADLYLLICFCRL